MLRPESIARLLTVDDLDEPRPVRLGGVRHEVTRSALLKTRVEGKAIDTKAYVVKEIGHDREAEKDFDILLGARSMREWGIELDMKNEELDLSKYPDEFVEFLEEIVWTPEGLVSEAGCAEASLGLAAESAEEIDIRIRLTRLAERAGEIHDALAGRYGVEAEREAAREWVRGFLEKGRPGWMRPGQAALSLAHSQVGGLVGDVEGGPDIRRDTIDRIGSLRRDILDLFHEWRRRPRDMEPAT